MKVILIGINSKYIHPAMSVFQLYTNADKKENDISFREFTIKDTPDAIASFINGTNAQVVAFGVYIWNVSLVCKLLPLLIDKIIVCGGPEASENHEILFPETDYIIRGEGEISFNELLSYLNKKIPVSKVSNLLFRKNGKTFFTRFSRPDLSFIKHDLSLIGDFQNRICYLESSRGCPYNCSYCLAGNDKPVRFFPAEEVLDNIRFLLNKKAKTVKFLDRSFTIREDLANLILSFIKENDNGITTFQFEVNGDNIAPSTIEIIKKMRRKSIRLEIGIQSLHTETLKAINRHQNFPLLKENILKLRDYAIIHTDLIAGLPFEDYRTFQNTFNETFLLFTEELQLGILKELKGTELAATKERYGYHFNPLPPYEVLSDNWITREELHKINLLAKGVNKFHNSGFFKNTFLYLFNVLKLNPFQTILKITEEITKEKELNRYPFPELTRKLYESLQTKVPDPGLLLFIIKEDYLMKHRIKPKIWWDPTVTRETRKKAYRKFASLYHLDTEKLYRSAHLERYLNQYLLIDYKTFKKYKSEIL